MSHPDPKTFYVTTPIYYVNARPHIGHAYTTVVADVLARRHRLLGNPTFFLTGTDEHGQKIERSAAAAGIPPQQFANHVSQTFRDLWDRMGITYDDFIRTTEPRHAAGVQHLFQQLQANNAIYKGTYTGQYCVSDEAYVDGPPGIHCPDCGRLTETVSEENYYFRLSAFQLPLLNLIEPGPNGEPPTLKIEPASRRNEVLSFLRGNVQATPQSLSSRPESSPSDDAVERPAVAPATTNTPGAPSMAQPHRDMGGNVNRPDQDPALAYTALGTPYLPGALKDLSISRTSFSWGIPVPGDEKHVIYVWLDALANYMTALGYGQETKPLFDKFWPANLHLVGKEIIRFHCVYWPAFLLALNPDWATLAIPEVSSQPHLPAPPEVSSHPHLPAPTEVSSRPERSEVERPASPSTQPPGAPTLGFDPAWAAKMLPKSVVAHGWLLFEESKMSKSRGNIVRTETILDGFGDQFLRGMQDHNARELKKDPAFQPVPEPTKRDRDLFATDVLRYFLLREIPFGQDGSFSFDAMVTRYNADLANGYGNLVSRVLKLVSLKLGGLIPDYHPWQIARMTVAPDGTKSYVWKFGIHFDPIRISLADWQLYPYVDRHVASNERGSRFTTALEVVWQLISTVDAYVNYWAPWKLSPEDPEELLKLQESLYVATEAVRHITAILQPYLPFSTARVWAQLGLGSIEDAAREGKLTNLQWGGLNPGTKLGPLAPIFPRADVTPDKGLARIMADIEATTRPANLPTNLQDVATDQHDAATPDTTAFAEAPLASVATPTTDQPFVAEAHTETQSPRTSEPPQTHASSRPESPRSSGEAERPAVAPPPQSVSSRPDPEQAKRAEGEAEKPPVPRAPQSVSSRPESPQSGDAVERPAFLPGTATPALHTLSSRPDPDQAKRAEGEVKRPAVAPAQSPGAPSMAQSHPDMGGNVSRSTTDPAAGPRTSSIPNGNPAVQVGGSFATTTATPASTTPTHVDAEPSGIFAGAAATTPVCAGPTDASPQITIDDFAKIELRVAQILVAERIPKADKLLRLEVDLGHERRQILSGIAEWYTPEELVGRRIVVITNLAPRKMRGLDSHGMLLAASGPSDAPGGGKPVLATFADTDTLPLGARLK